MNEYQNAVENNQSKGAGAGVESLPKEMTTMLNAADNQAIDSAT